MEDVYHKQLIAVGRGTTIGAVITMSFSRGATFARTGVGVVTATLDPSPSPVGALDAATDSLLWAQALTANNTVQPVDTSATVKTFNFFLGNTGAAAESVFIIEIYRLISR